MARCACCRKFMLGGKKQGEVAYCSDKCYEDGYLIPLAERVAPEEIGNRLGCTFEQPCPVCAGEGPVDIFTAHSAFSVIYLTRWVSRPQLSCVRCGHRAIRNAFLFTLVCGWWGFPFGLIVTPWQLWCGARALYAVRDFSQPSAELRRCVAVEVGHELVARGQTGIVPRRRDAA